MAIVHPSRELYTRKREDVFYHVSPELSSLLSLRSMEVGFLPIEHTHDDIVQMLSQTSARPCHNIAIILIELHDQARPANLRNTTIKHMKPLINWPGFVWLRQMSEAYQHGESVLVFKICMIGQQGQWGEVDSVTSRKNEMQVPVEAAHIIQLQNPQVNIQSSLPSAVNMACPLVWKKPLKDSI